MLVFPLPKNSEQTLPSEPLQEPSQVSRPLLEYFGNDQAASLRQFVSEKPESPEEVRRGRSLAILSGKGGVGKTNIAVNLALAAGQEGARVVVLDADLGLANVDILFGMMPRYNLSHVITGEKSLEDIIVTVDENVKVIPGGAGIQALAELDPYRREELLQKFAALERTEFMKACFPLPLRWKRFFLLPLRSRRPSGTLTEFSRLFPVPERERKRMCVFLSIWRTMKKMRNP